MSEARIYDSLTDLVKREALVMADPEQGPRVYRVKGAAGEKFAAAASPGQAALAVCEVELVPRKNLLTAALHAIGEATGEPAPAAAKA